MNRTPLIAATVASLLFGATVHANPDSVATAIAEDSSQTLAIVENAVRENPDEAAAIVAAAVEATQATGEMTVAIVEAASLGLAPEAVPAFLDAMAAQYPEVAPQILAMHGYGSSKSFAKTPSKTPAKTPAEIPVEEESSPRGEMVYIEDNPPVEIAAGQIFLSPAPGYLGNEVPVGDLPDDPSDPDDTPTRPRRPSNPNRPATR